MDKLFIFFNLHQILYFYALPCCSQAGIQSPPTTTAPPRIAFLLFFCLVVLKRESNRACPRVLLLRPWRGRCSRTTGMCPCPMPTATTTTSSSLERAAAASAAPAPPPRSELRSHYSSFIYYRPSPLPCPPPTPTPMAAGRPFMEENSLGQETKTPVFIHSDSHYDKNR
jgi:hypothetical protein